MWSLSICTVMFSIEKYWLFKYNIVNFYTRRLSEIHIQWLDICTVYVDDRASLLEYCN